MTTPGHIESTPTRTTSPRATVIYCAARALAVVLMAVALGGVLLAPLRVGANVVTPLAPAGVLILTAIRWRWLPLRVMGVTAAGFLVLYGTWMLITSKAAFPGAAMAGLMWLAAVLGMTTILMGTPAAIERQRAAVDLERKMRRWAIVSLLAFVACAGLLITNGYYTIRYSRFDHPVSFALGTGNGSIGGAVFNTLRPPQPAVRGGWNVVPSRGPWLVLPQYRFFERQSIHWHGWALSLQIPLYLPAAVSAGLPIWYFLPFRLRRRRQRLGLCTRCGYDLRASPECCPECGPSASRRSLALRCWERLRGDGLTFGWIARLAGFGFVLSLGLILFSAALYGFAVQSTSPRMYAGIVNGSVIIEGRLNHFERVPRRRTRLYFHSPWAVQDMWGHAYWDAPQNRSGMLIIPLYLPALACGAVFLAFHPAGFRSRRRRRGLCIKCGADVSNAVKQCEQCQTPVITPLACHFACQRWASGERTWCRAKCAWPHARQHKPRATNICREDISSRTRFSDIRQSLDSR